MKLKIFDILNGNKEVGDITIADSIVTAPERRDILKMVVDWQLAKRRQGSHKTKGISEIRGTTAKPFRQKGTGNARQGSKYAPQMRGGAIIFGPVVRSHAYKLPKKIKSFALRIAISVKHLSKNLFVIKNPELKKASTKDVKKIFADLKVDSALIVTNDKAANEAFKKSLSNIHKIDVIDFGGLNVLDILRHTNLYFVEDVVAKLEERLK
jgi:large subunit ribosomal protein L4